VRDSEGAYWPKASPRQGNRRTRLHLFAQVRIYWIGRVCGCRLGGMPIGDEDRPLVRGVLRAPGKPVIEETFLWEDFPYLTEDHLEKARRLMSWHKAIPRGKNEKLQLSPDDMEAMERWPTVFDLLTSNHYPDGEPREQSNLIIFCEGPYFKARLNEPTSGNVLWKAASSLTGLLDCLETELGSEVVDWRPDKPKRSR